jgi:hypothetical protein
MSAETDTEVVTHRRSILPGPLFASRADTVPCTGAPSRGQQLTEGFIRCPGHLERQWNSDTRVQRKCVLFSYLGWPVAGSLDAVIKTDAHKVASSIHNWYACILLNQR